MYIYLHSVQLAEDGLVLGIVACEIAQHPDSARYRGNVVGGQNTDQLTQQVVHVILQVHVARDGRKSRVHLHTHTCEGIK